jgi:hypothetical protein
MLIYEKGRTWGFPTNNEWVQRGMGGPQARWGQSELSLSQGMANLRWNIKSHIFYESQTFPNSSLPHFTWELSFFPLISLPNSMLTLHCLWSSFFGFMRQEPGTPILPLSKHLSHQGWVEAFGSYINLPYHSDSLSIEPYVTCTRALLHAHKAGFVSRTPNILSQGNSFRYKLQCKDQASFLCVFYISQNIVGWVAVMVHVCNPSTQESETRRSQVPDQPALNSMAPSQRTRNN